MSALQATHTSDIALSEILISLKVLAVDVAHTKLPADEISDTANLFNDCGMDSTSIIDFVLAVEEKFDITIDEEDLDLTLFQNLSTLADYVQSRVTPA